MAQQSTSSKIGPEFLTRYAVAKKASNSILSPAQGVRVGNHNMDLETRIGEGGGYPASCDASGDEEVATNSGRHDLKGPPLNPSMAQL
ncbi:hypothetical protein [Rhizobium lusitanum]|uniref:hypothetical protein n=1 Tax=Rhizobium lusitanum TaxID=293958 RepID=UPI001573373E|nr:hypothetical protein [Rhizobium lusitanum]NTJ11811.1 hypothetical protein [Rhizobium lusitanum]